MYITMILLEKILPPPGKLSGPLAKFLNIVQKHVENNYSNKTNVKNVI